MDNNPYPIFGATIPACRGREPDMEKIIRLIGKNHVSVVGPKHVGKTVFLRALAGNFSAGKDSFTGSIYWDMRHNTPTDDAGFYVEFARVLSDGLKSTSADAAAFLKDVKQDGYQSIETVFGALSEEKKCYLLCLDGFDDLLGSGLLTKNLWDNLRALGQLNSLKYATGSRRRLSELCVSRESRTSDFWRIFHDPPFTLGCFTEAHLGTFLAPFGDHGVTLSGGARTELLNWSGGIPLLTTVLCSRLWDGASSRSELTNESVNAVAESLLGSNSDTLQDLWRSFDGEQQRLLAEITTGADPSEDTTILRPLIDAGLIVVTKKRFGIPSRILGRYAAGEHGRVGSGLQKLFADRELFESNIRSIIEFRHLQMKGVVDEQIWDHLKIILENLDKPHIVITAPRAIINRAFELIWQRELPDRNIPGEWTREFLKMTDRPPQGRIQPDIGLQCRLLELMTDSRCAVETRVSRYTYTLINALPAPGNIGSHLLGPRQSVGYSVALAFWCLQLADQLANELAG
jgi:hypothetical protein